jgi:hypothetical protein
MPAIVELRQARAPSGSSMSAWLERALRTAPVAAAEAGGEAAAKLVSSSQILWLLGVLCAAVTAWIGAALLVGTAGATVGLALLVSGVGAGLLASERGPLVAGAFAMAVVGLGLIAGGVSSSALVGVAPTFAASLLVAETLALALVFAGRTGLAAPAAVAGAAATTGALAWVLEGSPIAAAPWGIAVGGGLAIVVSLHARWAEGALAARHGPGQSWQAAHSRLAEGPRGALTRVVGFFSADDDLFSSPQG